MSSTIPMVTTFRYPVSCYQSCQRTYLFSSRFELSVLHQRTHTYINSITNIEKARVVFKAFRAEIAMQILIWSPRHTPPFTSNESATLNK